MMVEPCAVPPGVIQSYCVALSAYAVIVIDAPGQADAGPAIVSRESIAFTVAVTLVIGPVQVLSVCVT